MGMETTFSLPAGSKLQWSTAISMMVFAWLFAAFWSVMPLLGWGEYDYEPLRTCCTLDYSKGDRWGLGLTPMGWWKEAVVPQCGLGSRPKSPSCTLSLLLGQISLPSSQGKAGTTWGCLESQGSTQEQLVSFLCARGWDSSFCYSCASSISCIFSGFQICNSQNGFAFM